MERHRRDLEVKWPLLLAQTGPSAEQGDTSKFPREYANAGHGYQEIVPATDE